MQDQREDVPFNAGGAFCLDDIRIDPAALSIDRSGVSERVEAKTMEVLLALAQQPGQVRARRDLERMVWPGRVVTDDALTNAVGKLRKALDDDARSPRIIETIAKRGYRLKVEPRPVGERTLPMGISGFGEVQRRRLWRLGVVLFSIGILVAGFLYWRAAQVPRIPAVAGQTAASIAVIPFDALGEQETQTYFAEGITLDVITALSRIPGLLVIAPGTAFGYRDSTQENPAIATELGVQYLIRGGVQRLGDRVRINVRLLRGDRGETLWAGRFAGDASSLFRIQDQVIEGITRALPVRLALSEPPGARLEATASIAAYDAFLQGQERYGRMTPEDNQAARRHFERAIELDPGFARAYAGLALAWSRLAIDGWTDDPAGDLLQAAEYADQATAIDPAVAQIHFVRAEVALFRGRHLAAAASAATAIELSPSYADAYALLAWIFNYAGRPDRAQAALNEAHRRNPRSSASYRQIAGEIAFTQGLYDKAVGEFQAALQRNPTHARARLWLAATLSELGQQDEAAWQVQELLTLNPAFSRSGLLLAFPLKDPDQREVVRRALAQLGLPE
jgi:TolB-like protein/DNA-binding winged helix-turn-helix (wHTH) protein